MTVNDPDVLVSDGLFARTRNPMYLGFVLLLSGVALLVGTVGAAIGPLLFFVASNWWCIPFEEDRMAAIFGAQYEQYRREVPRWIGVRG